MHALDEREFIGKPLVALHRLAHAVGAAFKRFHIGEDQFHIDDIGVAHRVNASVDVDYIRVVETANDVYDSVDFAYVRKKLVSETFALRRALDKSGYVDEFDDRRSVFFGVIHFCKFVETRIGHGHDADVRLYGAERVVRRLRSGVS